MKTLIYQQVYLMDEGTARLFSVSRELIRRLNPCTDYLLIDNASAINPLPYVRAYDHIHRWSDAIGHPAKDGGRDGPGRSHCKAIEIAIKEGYDKIAYVEADALVSLPIQWWLARQQRPVICQQACRHFPTDWHVWISDVAFLRDFDWIGKYDWPNRTATPRGEIVYQQLLGDNLQIIPIRGERWEMEMDPAKFNEIYGPMGGCDLITHVSRETNAEFLKMNNFHDLVENL